MAILKYPLPAWVPPTATIGDATLELADLMMTKPSRAHALRTILAKIAEVPVAQVPGGGVYKKFVKDHANEPLSNWGRSEAEDPWSPAAQRPQKVLGIDRARNAGLNMGADELEAIIRLLPNDYMPPPKAMPVPAQQPAGLSRAEVVELIDRMLNDHVANVAHAERQPVVVELRAPGKPPKVLGIQHESFPTLLKMVSARGADGHRLNVWLPGPAGSGKTRAAMEAAKALKLAFQFCGALDSAYALLGFTDVHGKTVRTPFREAYEHGGVFLFDEVDASDPSAVLALNAALANGHCAFPDAQVERHKDCCIIAAANTWGQGGTFEYVGRMKQDAAFLSRFVVLPWSYDEKLERAISGNEAWAEKVQATRRAAAQRGVQVVISPRASTNGAALLAAGLTPEEVATATIRQGMDDATWASVRGDMR
jgi:AAA domain (dynein-related subfamily)